MTNLGFCLNCCVTTHFFRLLHLAFVSFAMTSKLSKFACNNGIILSFQVFVSKIYTRHQRLLKKAKIQQNAFCPKNLQIKDKFKI